MTESNGFHEASRLAVYIGPNDAEDFKSMLQVSFNELIAITIVVKAEKLKRMRVYKFLRFDEEDYILIDGVGLVHVNAFKKFFRILGPICA
jgi:hypothetical protein